MSRSGMHEALVIPERPSRIATYAKRLNAAIDDYASGAISQPAFAHELRAIGVDERRVAELLAIPVYRYATKSDELIDEFEVCDECRSVDGQHWGDCQQIN